MTYLTSFPKAFGLSLLLVALTGCGDMVGDIEDNINEGLDSAQQQLEDAAKDAVLDELMKKADDNNGSAIIVRQGQEATLKIDEENAPGSPINGTEVFIPEDALADNVTEAVLAVYMIPDEVDLAFASNETQAGPGIEIQLQDLTLDNAGTTLTLETDATVYVLFDAGEVAQTGNLELGRMTGPREWDYLNDFALHSDEERISGGTVEFGRFTALEVDGEE